MNVRTLLDNFDLIADAPGGVPKLRELILQLAVRGKLVPQDPKEDPVRLFDCDKTKRGNNTDGQTFSIGFENADELPIGWGKVCLGEIGDWGSGSTPSRSNSAYYGGQMPWFKSGELNDNLELCKSEEFVTDKALQECSLRLNQPDDVLIAMYGATIGKLAIVACRCTTNQAVCACTCNELMINRYLFILLRALRPFFADQGAGAAQPNISKIKIVNTVVPLPPLPEQKRIVAKVDELMKRCDELESRQRDRAAHHKTLVASCLNAVSDTKKPNTNFITHNSSFNLLFSSPESIAELRKTILQLAVQGRLVKQVESEEPINDQDLPAGHTKRGNRCKFALTIAQDREPFPVPENWRWTSLGCLAARIEYGTSEKATKSSSGFPVFRMGNIRNGRLDYTDLKYVPTDCEDLPKLLLSDGDILFNRTNSAELVGKAAVFHGESQTMTFASYLVRVSLHPYIACPDFYGFVINSAYFRRTQIEPTLVQQCGQANFSGGKLAASVVPLPPFAEQKRIVAKVNELMTLCDALEAKLTQSRADADTLAAAIVHAIETGSQNGK